MMPHCGICKHFHRSKDACISNTGWCKIKGESKIKVTDTDGKLCSYFKENYEVVYALKKAKENIDKMFSKTFIGS